MPIRGCGGYVVFPFGLKGNNSYAIVCLLEMNFVLFILFYFIRHLKTIVNLQQ